MARPRIVTLRLTSPRMGRPAGDGNAALVAAVQHRLRGYGIEQDGAYGPRTAMAVSIWQERAGAPHVAGAIVPDELLVLLGYRKMPRDWVARRGDPVRRQAAREAQDRYAALAASERPAGALRIVAREDWCDFAPRARSLALHPPGVPHVVHWFGPGAAADGYDAQVAQVLRFARYHRFDLGWADLGYNWVVLRDGDGGRYCTVLEGRGRNVRGAHSGHNVANGYPGVLVLCGTGTPTPTVSQLVTVQALRTSEGWGRRTAHLEWYRTSCPGPPLWSWVQANR
ncbi:hypothetical protein [Miltoncostaea marina]|uniref:hypothetical protein n=1 Tax=Miltoncostaea marina TaxID=2843215 RepID=UPI001C3DE6B7|nr:hypothetical protein [Miltoncostaea marina]